MPATAPTPAIALPAAASPPPASAFTDSNPVVPTPGLTMPPPEFALPVFTYQGEVYDEPGPGLTPFAYVQEISDTEIPPTPAAPPAPTLPAKVDSAQEDRKTTVSSVLLAFAPWLGAAAIGAVLLLRGIDITQWWFWAVVALPYLLCIPLAALDRRRLMRWGFGAPASSAWILLTAPVYLMARTRAVQNEATGGNAPLWLLIANVALVAGAAVGLAQFAGVGYIPLLAEEIEDSIEAELRADGNDGVAHCPAILLDANSPLPGATGTLTCTVVDPEQMLEIVEPIRIAVVHFDRGSDYSFFVKPVD